LYCIDYGTKACNNYVLLDAKALAYKYLRAITLKGDDADWDLKDSCMTPEIAKRNQLYAVNPDWQTDAEMWGWED